MAEPRQAEPLAEPGPEGTGGKAAYLETLRMIERLHRRFLDVVKAELERRGLAAISNVQAMILYNIGDAVMTVGELTSRGYYQGSNVSYNLKKLVEGGYLEQERSPYDRRSVRVRLAPEGRKLVRQIDAIFDRHVADLARGRLGDAELGEVNRALADLERFWSDGIRFSPR
ncbi:MAG: MarR family transcriptional regulator [Proteobacteria bacterium]|nr:MarR family transcriptional regulator [Pseudomonadota bacterium]